MSVKQLVSEWRRVNTERGAIDVYVVTPGGGPNPAVIMFPEIFGVNDAMKEAAAHIAEQGLSVAAPDVFWRQQVRIDLGYTPDDRKRGCGFMQNYDFAEGVADMAAATKAVEAGRSAVTRTATLIEVTPRDGFRPIGPFIPTDDKVVFVEAAHAAGLQHRAEVEVGLCDTTGCADPDHVASLAEACLARWRPTTRFGFHGHDTYGLGLANVVAAWHAGIDRFDAAFGGLAGCPFVPGATGNTATEDVVWMFRRMGAETGVDLDALISIVVLAASLPGASPGGRVRAALASTCAA